MTDRTELKRMREEFLGITDDAGRLAFYAQHYETIKRGQADAESSYNYLKLEKEILEYLVKCESPAYPILINNLAGLLRDLASYEPENASGYLKDAKEYFEEAARIAKDSGDEKKYAIRINNLAGLLRDLASYEPENASGYLKDAKEYFEEAARIDKDSGDEKNYAIRINNLARLLSDLASYEPENASGYLKDAKEYYEEAARIAKDSGDEKKYAIRINNLAGLLRDLASYEPENASGYLKDAKEYFEEAARIAKDSGDEKNYAIRINNLAGLLRDLASYEPENASGYLKDAKEYFEEAARIDKDSGDEKNYAIRINNLARLLSDLASYEPENASGYLKDAKEYYEEAARIAKDSGDEKKYAIRINNLAGLLRDLASYEPENASGYLKDAKEHYEEAARIDKDSGDEKNYAIDINNLAGLLSDLASYEPENASGYLKDAKEHYEEAARIDKDSGDEKNYAIDINNLAGLLSDLASYEPENASGYLKDAKEHYEEAARIAKDSGDEKKYAIRINNLAGLLSDLASYEPKNASGYLKDAKEHYEEAARIDKDSGDEKKYAIRINNLAGLLRDLASYEPKNASGYLKDAKEHYEEAARIDKDSGDEKKYAIRINNLAGLLSDLASYEPENASGYLKDAHDHLQDTSIPNARKAKDWENLLRWGGNLSRILIDLYAVDNRIEHLTSAQSFLEESFRHPVTRQDLLVGNLRTLGNVHKRLADAYLSGNEQRSLEHLESASGCFQRLADLTGNEDHRIESLDLIIRSRSLLAKNTRDRRKRRNLYAECSDTASTLSEIQPSRRDEWESLSEYFRGQMCVNEGVRVESLKTALVHFESARENFARANVCYCLYKTILSLMEFSSQDAPSKMSEEIKSAITSMKQVSSPQIKKYIGFLEEMKRSLEADGSSVDPNKIRESVADIIGDLEYYALADFSRELASGMQRQSDRMGQVDFGVNLIKIGDKLEVTVSNHGKKPLVGTLTIESLDRRLKLNENTIELQGKNIVTNASRHKSFCLSCSLASGVSHDPINCKTDLKIAGQKPITKHATLPLGNVIDIEGKGVTVESITLPEECLIYDDKIQMALVQLEIELVHDGNGYRISGDLDAYLERIRGIISKLPNDVEIVIFPELSIPFEFLSKLQRISKDRNLLIVAGSHYITSTDGYPELGFVRTVREKDIWKSISPLITPSGDIYHSEKIFPAPTYEQKMTRGDYLNIYKFRNSDYKFTVLICIDFERDAPGMLMDKFTPNLINVISVNSGKSARERYYNRFSSLARSRGSIAFTYTNVSGFSLDGIAKSTDDKSGKSVEHGYSNIFSEYYYDEKPKEKRVWGQHFTKYLEGDLIRIFQHNLKGGTSVSTRTDYVPIFEEIDLIRLD